VTDMAVLPRELRAALAGVPELAGPSSPDPPLVPHPERRLMVAVLHEALVDWGRGARDGAGAELVAFRRAAAWFRSADTRWPYSFVNVCEGLGISPSAVRKSLRRSRPVRRRARAGWLGRR
jgi:hypothetical protein